MAELMPQKVWTSDAEGNKNYFNKILLDYAGMTTEELTGTGWEKIMHPDDWEKNKKLWEESISTGKNYETENRLLRNDGKFFWHLTRAVAIKDENDKIKMWVGSKTEIDTMKIEEIRKGNFIKMVSHELKTPVTSIKGYVQLLLTMLENEQQLETSLPLKSSLARIDSQVSRLTRLITEMLDLSRIEAGKLELQKKIFSLDELVTETVQDIKFTNTHHTIIISRHFTCSVYGDKDRIEQVIINLINNAIKYSPDNNRVEIRIDGAENNQVAVSIQDFGIGIDMEHQQKIFARFYRAAGNNGQGSLGNQPIVGLVDHIVVGGKEPTGACCRCRRNRIGRIIGRCRGSSRRIWRQGHARNGLAGGRTGNGKQRRVGRCSRSERCSENL